MISEVKSLVSTEPVRNRYCPRGRGVGNAWSIVVHWHDVANPTINASRDVGFTISMANQTRFSSVEGAKLNDGFATYAAVASELIAIDARFDRPISGISKRNIPIAPHRIAKKVGETLRNNRSNSNRLVVIIGDNLPAGSSRKERKYRI